MQTLIYKRPTSHFLPHLLPPNLVSAPSERNQNFLRFHLRKCRYTSESLTSCLAASSHSLSYGGWDDLQLGSGSVQSGESNQLQDFLNFLGIGDKKYVFVYLFGFVCALAVSRVKVSSLVIFPACAILFAIGFSVGLVKGGHLKELKLNGNKRKLLDETFRDSLEKLRNFGDSLKGYNAEVLKLRNDIRIGIESNQITVSDLEAYIGVIESSSTSFLDAMDDLESCIQSMSNVNLEKEVGSDQESTRRRKRTDGIGFNFSQYFNGLFGGKFDGSKPGKVKDSDTRESVDVDLNNQRQENILASSVKQRNLNSARNRNFENKNTDMVGDFFDGSDTFADGTMENVVENEKRNITEKNEVNFDDTTSSYQKNMSRFVSSQEAYVEDYQDEIETTEYQNGSFDSMNFSISMNHTKTAASFSRHQKNETQNRNDSRYESSEEKKTDFQKYCYKKEMLTSEKQPSFDLEFNNYVTEANDLLKEAKRSLKQKVIDERAEHALYKSEVLLSKAIEMRPMSLLAVGQLGNTYLLHGELKLRISRDLRYILARNDPFQERRKILKRFDDELANKDEIMPKLVGVCEECEELLVKAGRKYKLALSIDGNDVKALYNWGLALSFRAQLIADIGPSAARDADKVFLAAIDKFDAMMSKSNDYAPDALFRWGSILQQRSRLRPKNSREKVKLLQQARRLYQDALDLDSGNLPLQKALSSCVSELDYWYT